MPQQFLIFIPVFFSDLKQQAQNSLDTVMQIRNLSEAAIQTAQALREQLRVAFNNAELARQQMTTAEALQRSKRDVSNAYFVILIMFCIRGNRRKS